MADREELLRLAERLEQATGPDQELSNDILMLTGIGSFDQDMTASLDAAMTLLPDGWDWTLGRTLGFNVCADLWQSGKVPGHRGVAATPALALAAASLRARAQEERR